MFISVTELQDHRIVFGEQFEPRKFDLGSDIHLEEPLKTSGHAELIEENHSHKVKIHDIRLVGDFSTQVAVGCARCLELVTRKVSGEFDLIYRPQGVDAVGSQVSIGPAETEIGYYQGDGLLLEDALKEQVILAIPLKLLCGEECKGLCAGCGSNLNHERCSCTEAAPDPRWAALKDLKDKIKN